MPGERSGRPSGPSRRRFVAGVGTVGAAALAGCGGSGGDGSDGSDGDADGSGGGTDTDAGDGDGGDGPTLPNDITFLHYETNDERRAAIGELAAEFEGESGVGVEQRVVQESDLPTELTTAVASGTLPNVGSLSLAVLHSAVDAVDADSAGRVIEEIGADRFYDNLLEMVSTPGGDGYYGVPLYTWPQLTIYRTGLFEERGLPEPRTWDDIREAAATLHDPENDQFGIVLGTKVDQYTRQCFTGFALSNGARVFGPDGGIVFDSDEMVEALEFYADLAGYTPPGGVDAGSIGPAYDNDQVHLYSGNSFSLYYNALGVEEGELMTDGVVPSIDRDRTATYGEVVSTATFTGQSDGGRRAAERWQSFLRGSRRIEDYVQWCHIQVGGFQPVLPEVAETDAYRDNDLIRRWPDEITEAVLPEAIRSAQRFGFRDGEVYPEIGEITGNFMIARAVSDVIGGADARSVAEATAEEMRERID